MRGTVKEFKQFPAEFQRHKGVKRSRGDITEQGGGSEGDEDQGEGQRRFYLED